MDSPNLLFELKRELPTRDEDGEWIVGPVLQGLIDDWLSIMLSFVSSPLDALPIEDFRIHKAKLDEASTTMIAALQVCSHILSYEYDSDYAIDFVEKVYPASATKDPYVAKLKALKAEEDACKQK